jgi:hypothetical protein
LAAVVAAVLTVALMAAPAQAHRMAHCHSDDGSGPRPCVWDARHMGDGEGRSFVKRIGGRIDYVGHRRAHHLAYAIHV